MGVVVRPAVVPDEALLRGELLSLRASDVDEEARRARAAASRRELAAHRAAQRGAQRLARVENARRRALAGGGGVASTGEVG